MLRNKGSIVILLTSAVGLLAMMETLWVSDSFAEQKQYDLDVMNFAELPPRQAGEAIVIVDGPPDFSLTGNDTWSGQVVDSDSVVGSYKGSGLDAIVFPCEEGKPYSLKFEHLGGYIDLYLTDNTGINLVADSVSPGLVIGNHTVTTNDEQTSYNMAGTCSKAPPDTENLIEHLYDYERTMRTPEFLDTIDAVRTQEGDPIAVTGSLTPKELHENLIKTPISFPAEGMAMMLVRFDGSWSGHVMSGGDSASRDGYREGDIEFPCAPGVVYSVSVQKDTSYGDPTLRLAVITKDKILDLGETDTRYGIVSLSGTC